MPLYFDGGLIFLFYFFFKVKSLNLCNGSMEVTENVCDCTLARVERALLKKEYKEV